MRDDELMDNLLRDALKAEIPQLPRGFDEKVLRRVRGPKLDARGRAVMAIYGAASASAAVWLMRDVPLEWVGVSLVVLGGVAAGISAYVRSLSLPGRNERALFRRRVGLDHG